MLCREVNAFGLAFLLFLGALRLELMMLCKGQGSWALENKKKPTKILAVNFTVEEKRFKKKKAS